MFGFGKSAKLKEIDQRFGQILHALGSGGDHRATEAVEGIRNALQIAHDLVNHGVSDTEVTLYLAKQAHSAQSNTPGKRLGYLLVTLTYEARSLATKDAFNLAHRIQAFASETTARFPRASSEQPSSYQGHNNPRPGPDEVLDETLESGIAVADILRYMLKDMEIYEKTPGVLLRPHALGYIWGWCDATTQKLGIPLNSGEALGISSAMFLSFFKNQHFDQNSREDFNTDILLHANRLRDSGEKNFFEGMTMGGSDLFDFFRAHDVSKIMVKNIGDIFADGYVAMSRTRRR